MQTNREHFSWSQYYLWQTSKREYWKRYSMGVEAKTNRFFDKGKELANYMDGEPVSLDDPMLELVVDQIPRLDFAEDELSYNVHGSDKKVICFVDHAKKDGSAFIEYKTGKIPWTQEKVDEHDQMLFYALGYYITRGVIPTSELVWVETMETENGLRYTGMFKSFQRTFTMEELDNFAVKIENTIKEIADYDYQELEVDVSDIERYIHLQNIIAEANLELSGIKMKVQAEMLAADVTFGKGELGNFIISNRKTWKYSEFVDELKNDIKKQQAKEQKSGDATFSTSQSIMFKLNK